MKKIVTFRRLWTASLAALTIGLASMIVAPSASAAAGLTCTDGNYHQSSNNQYVGYAPVYRYANGGSTRSCYMNSSRGAAVAVRHLQKAYNACYAQFGNKLVVDGDYGDLTEAAVRVIQSKEGLVPTDGLYGPSTALRMRIPDEDTFVCFR